MKYTRKQLVEAQIKYDQEYLKNPNKFVSGKDIIASQAQAESTIDFLISLVGQ